MSTISTDVTGFYQSTGKKIESQRDNQLRNWGKFHAANAGNVRGMQASHVDGRNLHCFIPKSPSNRFPTQTVYTPEV